MRARTIVALLATVPVDWCIQAGDFGTENVATLEVLSRTSSRFAVDAFVTELVGDKKNPQVIERPLHPMGFGYVR